VNLNEDEDKEFGNAETINGSLDSNNTSTINQVKTKGSSSEISTE
jgi:hypothetical protein